MTEKWVLREAANRDSSVRALSVNRAGIWGQARFEITGSAGWSNGTEINADGSPRISDEEDPGQ